MKFEEILPLMRQGRKFRRPFMSNTYYTVTNNCLGYGQYKEMLVAYISGVQKSHGSLPLEDLLADDWVEFNPVITVNMTPLLYKVDCACGRAFNVGAVWRARTGDKISCPCGKTILIAPPIEEVRDAEQKQAQKESYTDKGLKDPWPKA